MANVASLEGLENLGYSSKARIMEIANLEQEVGEEIIQFIENRFEIEIETEEY